MGNRQVLRVCRSSDSTLRVKCQSLHRALFEITASLDSREMEEFQKRRATLLPDVCRELQHGLHPAVA